MTRPSGLAGAVLTRSHWAYSHWAYSHWAYSHWAYSHWAYSHWAYSLWARSLWVAWGLVCLAGCGNALPSAQVAGSDTEAYQGDYPIRAVATVGMVADIVRNGRRTGPRHADLRPRRRPPSVQGDADDVQTIMTSDLVFYAGLMLEGKMTDTLVKVARHKPVVAVTEQIAPSCCSSPPTSAVTTTRTSGWTCLPGRRAWRRRRPQGIRSAAFGRLPARADAYRAQLAALHDYGLKSLATIPRRVAC